MGSLDLLIGVPGDCCFGYVLSFEGFTELGREITTV